MPQGANIKQLSYSKEVEASAEKWAEKCTMNHSHGNYGENLFMSSNSKTKTGKNKFTRGTRYKIQIWRCKIVPYNE